MDDLDKVIGFYKSMHRKKRKFRGYSTKKHVPIICELVEKHKPSTLLDYGCGKGMQYKHLKLHEKWGGIMPHLYDPGVPEYSDKPCGKFDGVLCIDVLEHVPEHYVDSVIGDIFSFASDFIFFNVSTELAHKYLPDGRNVHLTVKPREWWTAHIDRAARRFECVDVLVDFETPRYSGKKPRASTRGGAWSM